MPDVLPGRAQLADVRADGVLEVTHDVGRLDAPGFWVVVRTFEGRLTAARMAHVEYRPAAGADAGDDVVPDPDLGPWRSSLDETAYVDGVREIRRRIEAGEVYQVNLCRVLERDLPVGVDLDVLSASLQQRNPSPYAARVMLPTAGVDLVSASPELFLARRGELLRSGPIKGTAPTLEGMLPKDSAENVMITDLVRNDLSPVARPGTVVVEGLCVPEEHPGLVHLVSTVRCALRADATWGQVMDATFPPGSVSGAPKSTALKAIRDLEPVARGPYCGAVGWIDNDRRTASLAVGIRTFWADRGSSGGRVLRFGTGAGITWGSDPQGEWCETVLKARRLVSLAGVLTTNDE